MISGLGSDICNIERIAGSYKRFGERFVNRCFGKKEQAEFPSAEHGKQYAEALAKRFAAKEAFVKALGTGFRYGLRWSEIEVLHEESGKPYILLSGKTLRFAENFGVKKIWVSLSDDYPYTQAVVILENLVEKDYGI